MTEPEPRVQVATPAPVRHWGVLWTVAGMVAAGGIAATALLVHVDGTDTGPQRACEAFVRGELVAPSTARFSGVQFFDGSPARVLGDVDSQNGFGAMLRSSFACTMTRTADGWSVESGYVI